MALPAVDLTQLLTDLRRTRTLVTPEELAHRLPPVLPTGLGPLDRLLGGGLPQGRIVEIGEAKGSLGTSLVLGILANATRSGRLAALVDRSDCFDPRSAADAGLDLDRTLWCRPANAKDAVRAADVLLASGAFALVVLDLGPVPTRRRGPRTGASAVGAADALARSGRSAHVGASDSARSERSAHVGASVRMGGPTPLGAEDRVPGEPHLERWGEGPPRKKRDPDAETVTQGAWLRLSRDAETARASLLVLGGGGAGTFASATLRPLKARARFLGEGPGRTFEGLELSVALERNKLGLSPGQAALSFRAPELFPTGIRDPAPGCARVDADPASSRRKAWGTGGLS